MKWVLFSFCVLNLYSVLYAADSPIVSIDQGQLQGLELTSRQGLNYYGYLGIPFVDKPGRFQPPSLGPPKPWEGIRDAKEFGPRCIQFDAVKNQSAGEEDCLFLNVYTPDVNDDLPVMVYIHGGGFQWGAGHIHQAKYFMDENVVLVTFNYRLGPFGFLSTGDTIVQGNMGLKDQVAALKWVKSNIREFGGNPRLVTVFGESAGGGTVSLLVLSEMSKGLFQHAISQSGAALNPWACLKNPKLSANELGENMNCPIDSSKGLVDCLLSKNEHELVAYSFAKWYLDPTVPFGPVVEQLLPGQQSQDVFLSRTPFEILEEGSFNKVPWIVGICKEEGIYFHSSSILKDEKLTRDVNNDWHKVAPISLTYYEDPDVPKQELDLVSDIIKTFYFGAENIEEKTRKELTNLYSDRYFVHGIRTTAVMQAKHGSPVYLYTFNFEGKFSFLQQRGFEKGLGVTHKDDLQYLFDGISPELTHGRDADFSRNFVRLWASFAREGKPVSTWGSAGDWKPVSKDEASSAKRLQWFSIDEDTAYINEPFTNRMDFWDNLMNEHEVVSFPRGPTSNLGRQEL